MCSTTRKATLYLFQIAISGILMLILMPIISQNLTPNDLGQFVLSQVYTGIAVGIANFGMLLSYERNFFMFEESKKNSAKLMFSAIFFVGFNLTILLIIVYLFQSEIGSLVFSANAPDNLLLLVFIGTAASSLSQYYLTFLKNSGLAMSYIKYAVSNSVINFSIAVGLLTQLDIGVMSLAYAWIISNSILLILLFIHLERRLPISFDFKMLKGMLRISLPLTPRVFFGFMNTQLDKILLGFIGTSGLVGIYHMGQTFAMTIFQFMTGLDRVFQPEIYRKLFANKHIKNPYEINDYIFPFFYASLFVAFMVVLFAKEFVLLFLSEEYQDATLIIVILAIYYASLFFGKVTGNQLIYAKKTHITTLLTLFGIAINVGLNIPFIVKWGIVGAAWATTISGVILTLTSYIVAQRYVNITWKRTPIFLIYGIFLLAAMFSIIDYNFAIYLYLSLVLKLVFILLYIVIGYMENLISIQNIKKILFIKCK